MAGREGPASCRATKLRKKIEVSKMTGQKILASSFPCGGIFWAEFVIISVDRNVDGGRRLLKARLILISFGTSGNDKIETVYDNRERIPCSGTPMDHDCCFLQTSAILRKRQGFVLVEEPILIDPEPVRRCIMASELNRRLGRLRVPALLRMRHYKGPYELVNWWDHFTRSIPKDAEFDDLDTASQNLILGWEREIIKSLPTSPDSADMDLEMQAIVYEWERGSIKKTKAK